MKLEIIIQIDTKNSKEHYYLHANHTGKFSYIHDDTYMY